MLDPFALRFPYFNGMWATCKSNPTKEAYTNIRNQIGDLVLQYDKYGEADEEFLDQCKIKVDTDLQGEEVRRDAKGLHLRRATIINHSAIVQKRRLEEQKNRATKLAKMEEANDVHRHKILANDEAVLCVLKAADDDGHLGDSPALMEESSLEHATLQNFSVLKLKQLKAFIVAHDDELERLSDIPKKGNLKEVVEHGAHNAISMAYNCRMKKNLLEGNYPHSDEDLAKVAGRDEDWDTFRSNALRVSTVRLGEGDQILPSQLLDCALWRASITRLFRLNSLAGEQRVDPGESVSVELKGAANRLALILCHRFRMFLKLRIPHKGKRDHWCMHFAFNNLPVVAALIVLSGHAKPDLECLNERDSLLLTDVGAYTKCEDCPECEGAYLYFDVIRGVFVRSGKVAGRGFLERIQEHVKGASEAKPSSTFYKMYPSKGSARSQHKRRGHFEYLKPVVAAGFDPSGEEAGMLHMNFDNGGILVLSSDEKKLINSSMKNLKCSNQEKFRHMLAYQIELGYDLCLAPGDVVSTNPGFESVLGLIIS